MVKSLQIRPLNVLGVMSDLDPAADESAHATAHGQRWGVLVPLGPCRLAQIRALKYRLCSLS